jgi:hypothetical protein
MYYITNLNKQLIGANSSFLKFLSVETLPELFNMIAVGNLKIDDQAPETLTIELNGEKITVNKKRHPMSTLMGNIVLYELSQSKIEELPPQKPIVEEVSLAQATPPKTTPQPPQKGR